MNRQTKLTHFVLSLLICDRCSALAVAAPITVAPDGTGTQTIVNGNAIDISGGTRAGGNLFHSFQQFNLDAAQTPNFCAHPTIHNILRRRCA